MRALIKFAEAKEYWDENIDAALYAYRIAKHDFPIQSLLHYVQPSPSYGDYHELSCSDRTDVTVNITCADMEKTLDNLLRLREKYHGKALQNNERSQT